MPKKISVAFLAIGSLLLFACTPTEPPSGSLEESHIVLPDHFPPLPSPKGNTPTEDRITMGRFLFYDTALSLDSSLSCASCHLQEAAFADHNKRSVGIQNKIGTRNVPSLANTGYHPYYFAEGGSPSLEMQMIGPICSVTELGFNSKELVERLEMNPFYDSLAHKAYGRGLDLFTLTRSIAAFERSIISGNSPYDAYLQGDTLALSPLQLAGKHLFFSEAWGCGSCHSGHLLSNFAFENIGLYSDYPDKGRVFVSLDSLDEGKFKVPSLRNVALTYPYMHDGSLSSLEEVIEHFNAGAKGHKNQHPLIRPLNMTEEEKAQLMAFLNSLTDTSLLENISYSDPFKP